jgi:hypothetical protein
VKHQLVVTTLKVFFERPHQARPALAALAQHMGLIVDICFCFHLSHKRANARVQLSVNGSATCRCSTTISLRFDRWKHCSSLIVVQLRSILSVPIGPKHDKRDEQQPGEVRTEIFNTVLSSVHRGSD